MFNIWLNIIYMSSKIRNSAEQVLSLFNERLKFFGKNSGKSAANLDFTVSIK